MSEVQKAIHRIKTPGELTDLIEMIEDGIEAQIAGTTRAGQVGEEFQQAGKVVEAGEHIAGASLDEGFYLTQRMRHVPGTATGGTSLQYASRLLPDGKVGLIPGQIAEKLRAIGHFDDFADFRAAFWRLVADDPVLGLPKSPNNPNGWSRANLKLMRSGRPPRVGTVGGVYQGVGGRSNAVVQLNHRQALEHAGQLYDLDNIEVVTPWFHRQIGQ
jgi:hypothetical protein